MAFSSFLNIVNPQLYQQMKFEKFKSHGTQNETISEIFLQKPKGLELDIVCKKIYSLDPSHPARKYLDGRLIPELAQKSLYFIEDFSRMKEVFPNYEKLQKDPRIVIPIYTRQGELAGITARAINATNLRYVSLRGSTDAPLYYNFDRLDLNKKVYTLEGAFDSMFLPNAMGIEGADFKRLENYLSKKAFVAIFDNQPRNRLIVEKIERCCDQGFNLVVWPEGMDVHGKDINELIKAGLSVEKIMQTIDENTFSGLKCKLMINEWKRV
jgi:hypothetical protein